MCRIALLLTTIILLNYDVALGDEKEPRRIVERALQASGDNNWLLQLPATYARFRTTVGELDNIANVEMKIQNGAPIRCSLNFTAAVSPFSVTIIINGKSGWKRDAGSSANALSEKERFDLSWLNYHERVSYLQALLQDKRIILKTLGESKIAGKTVVGVKICGKGNEDLCLYFDKVSGLLARLQYQQIMTSNINPIKYEITYLDYFPVDTGAHEKTILKKAGIGMTGPELIAFLRKLLPERKIMKRVKMLVGKLDDEAFSKREQATKELMSIGVAAVPTLERALRSPSLEVRRRARVCLKQIAKGESAKDYSETISVIHLLALEHPAGAAGVLLDLLSVCQEKVACEVRAALYHLGADSDQPAPELLAALIDTDPTRKAAAEAAMGKDGGSYARLPNRRIYRPDTKRPRKIIILYENDSVKSKTVLEIQVENFYNCFDDKIFAKP